MSTVKKQEMLKAQLENGVNSPVPRALEGQIADGVNSPVPRALEGQIADDIERARAFKARGGTQLPLEWRCRG
jgi:hypothetical protein